MGRVSALALKPAAAASASVIQVLVVDDSAIVRGLISRQLATDPDIRVAGSAIHGEAALMELGRRHVDVVVLDIEMPVMDGLTALPLILSRHPNVKVVMASSLTRRNAEVSLRALQLGASDYIAKPEGGLVAAEEFQRDLIAKVKALGRKSARPTAAAPAPIPVTPLQATTRRAPAKAPTVLAIGASTGGPPALLKLFEGLKGAVAQPILLTQHMPATFTALLAEQLTRASGRPCAEGRDGERVLPGHCYVAPGGWHMVVANAPAGPVIRLNQAPPENFCRPAVDPLFRSVAQVYGPAAMGLILTGMGADGAKGCEALVGAGGRFAVQDEATSVVWGMPGAAAATGLAEAVLPLTDIATWLRLKLGAAA